MHRTYSSDFKKSYGKAYIYVAYTYIQIHICLVIAIFRSYHVPLTSDGFVAHFPLPEHSNSFEWLPPGTQVLAFTTKVKRKATMDLATESFTKPKRKQDSKKCKASSFNTLSTLEFCLG